MAKFLGISQRTLREWQAHRAIPYIKVARATIFSVEDVVAALKRFERKAA
jgi:hypothetical protein